MWHAVNADQGMVFASKTKAGVLGHLGAEHNDPDPRSTRDDADGTTYVYATPNGATFRIGREDDLRAAGFGWAFDGERNPNSAPDGAGWMDVADLEPGVHEVAVAGWRWEPVLDIRPHPSDDGDRAWVVLVLGDPLEKDPGAVVARDYTRPAAAGIMARRRTGDPPRVLPRPHERGRALR